MITKEEIADNLQSALDSVNELIVSLGKKKLNPVRPNTILFESRKICYRIVLELPRFGYRRVLNKLHESL